MRQRLAEQQVQLAQVVGSRQATPGAAAADTQTMIPLNGTAVPAPVPAPVPWPTRAHLEGTLGGTRMVKRFDDIYAEIIQQLIEAGASLHKTLRSYPAGT